MSNCILLVLRWHAKGCLHHGAMKLSHVGWPFSMVTLHGHTSMAKFMKFVKI